MNQNTRRLALLLLLACIVDFGKSQNICSDPTFDTIFSTPNSIVYVMKGDNVWQLSPSTTGDGYEAVDPPQLISRRWRELPSNIDASFTNYETGLTYFLKGSQVWQYSDQQLQSGFPKPISQEFPGIPSDIDLAYMCSGGYYFYKGDKFWGYNLKRRTSSGPYSIVGFLSGLPINMNAAVQLPSGGYTYFFKGVQYYKFKVSTSAVDVANPGYPRDTKDFWFGCQDIISEPDFDVRAYIEPELL